MDVPDTDTTYMCVMVDLPHDTDYHIVGMEPALDNINVVHHMTVYGCDNPRRSLGLKTSYKN